MTDKQFKEAKNLSEVCRILMAELYTDIQAVNTLEFGRIPNYTRIQNDIIRLRRELNKLSKKLYPWEENK